MKPRFPNEEVAVLPAETTDGAGLARPSAIRAVPRVLFRPIPIALILGFAVVAAVAAFERVGTRANAGTVEFTIDYGGGFLAIGMSDDQPGFIVLSALDQEQVDVSAEQARSVVAGEYTFVEIRTARHQFRTRLRDPQVIVIAEDGAIDAHRVKWRFEDFVRIRTATDCSDASSLSVHGCGAPFADLLELVSVGRLEDVPEGMQTFLKRSQ